MIRFINKTTGGDMWAHETRVEDYLARGHRLADPPAPLHPIGFALPEDDKPRKGGGGGKRKAK